MIDYLEGDWAPPPVTPREKLADLVGGLVVVALVGVVWAALGGAALTIRAMAWLGGKLP